MKVFYKKMGLEISFIFTLVLLLSCGGNSSKSNAVKNVDCQKGKNCMSCNSKCANACTMKDSCCCCKLAIQSYSFHKFTLTDALDKTQALGLHYIEVFPGHKLGGKWGEELTFGPDLSEQTRNELKELAQSKDIKIVAMGVVVPETEAEWEKIFSFAKAMNMEFITCEPIVEQWDYVESLVKKYDIKIAVHNHPQPSTYWKPENLLELISKRDARIGSCADVGHWRREGLDQIECLKKLNGRVISLHFKDIAPKTEGEAEQHDVIWGTGILDVKAMLQELKAQGFNGYYSIEYEYNWDNSVPDIQKCIEYFCTTQKELNK